MVRIARMVAPAVFVWLLGASAHAASPADRCEAAKLKISTKYSSCLLKAQLKAVKKPAAEISGDLAKCDTTFTDKWAKAEKKDGAACPTSGDAGSTQSLVTSFTSSVVDRFRPIRFVDNGDGTITDRRTGLTWEKKDGADGVPNYGDPDDVDNLYTWSNSDVMPDGTAFTEFQGSLNNCYLAAAGPTIVGGLGGHCDWRLPTLKELTSIYDDKQPGCGGTVVPCIPPIFLPVGIDPTPIRPFMFLRSATGLPSLPCPPVPRRSGSMAAVPTVQNRKPISSALSAAARDRDQNPGLRQSLSTLRSWARHERSG